MYNIIFSCLITIFIILVWCYIRTKLNKKWWENWNMNKHNFPFIHNGKELWYSRSMSVTSFVFCKDKFDNWRILTEVRGKGGTDKGKICVPCGYLDWNETLTDAASRELYEETGLSIDPREWKFYNLYSNPKLNLQNLRCFYYKIIEGKTIEDIPLTTQFSEKNEIEDIKWVKIEDVKDKDDRFAFEHNTSIIQIFNDAINNFNDETEEKQ